MFEFNCELSTQLVCQIWPTSSGLRRVLSHSPSSKFQFPTKPPLVHFSTGPFELLCGYTAHSGPLCGFTSFAFLGASVQRQASVFAQRALPGRGEGSFGNAMWLAGSFCLFGSWATAAMQTSRSPFISSGAARSHKQCCMTAANQREWVI